MADGRIRVLGIAGSLRKRSYNRALLRAARDRAPEGMEVAIWDRLGEIPPYNADVEAEGDPEPVAAFKDAIRAADGLLIVTPEYQQSIPGVLKNAIDWASRPPGETPLRGKPAAILGATPGFTGTARAQSQLRQVLVYNAMPAVLQPEVLVARAGGKFDDRGNLTDQETGEWVDLLLDSLAELIRLYRRAGS